MTQGIADILMKGSHFTNYKKTFKNQTKMIVIDLS